MSAIDRLNRSSEFRVFAKEEYRQNAEIWEREAEHGGGVIKALGVAICAIGGSGAGGMG